MLRSPSSSFLGFILLTTLMASLYAVGVLIYLAIPNIIIKIWYYQILRCTMKSCFFIGHREISEEIFSALTEAVEHHIVHCGVTESKQIRSGRISIKRNWKSAVTQHPTWSGISLSKRIRSIRSQTGFTLWSITIKNGTPERTKFFARKSRINTGFTERIRYIFRLVI